MCDSISNKIKFFQIAHPWTEAMNQISEGWMHYGTDLLLHPPTGCLLAIFPEIAINSCQYV